MNAVGENREKAIEDSVPHLGVELLGQLHRALHVGEHHGHLLAFAFQRGLGLQDLVGEVLWRVVTRVTHRRDGIELARGGAAFETELRSRRKLRCAAGAAHREASPALQAELCSIRVLMPAGAAVHLGTLPERAHLLRKVGQCRAALQP